MEWEIELDDLKPTAIRRMLKEAISKEKERSLPLHRRKAKAEAESVDEDEATEEAEDENEKLVDLVSEQGAPNEIPMTDEDMSEEASRPLVNPKAPAKKIGKPFQPK